MTTDVTKLTEALMKVVDLRLEEGTLNRDLIDLILITID
jgi:hypothetical protein